MELVLAIGIWLVVLALLSAAYITFLGYVEEEPKEFMFVAFVWWPVAIPLAILFLVFKFILEQGFVRLAKRLYTFGQYLRNRKK